MPAPPADTPPAATGLVYHPDYLTHAMPPGHPERPERLAAIVEHLRETGLWDAAAHIEPTPATAEQVARVHGTDYIAAVAELCERGGGLLDMSDTPVCPASYDVALLAAGGLLRAAFCVFNNIAVAARYLQAEHGLGHVLIADWDVHHGNGTQDAFYDDPSVAFLSLHRYPFYPGTGAADEQGIGEGRGSVLNVPLRGGTSGAEFVGAFRDGLERLAAQFPPDIVLVSAGFDGHRDDPLGGMALTEDDYAELARLVRAVADERCDGRLLLTLEGGYDLAALGRSVAAVLRVLLE